VIRVRTSIICPRRAGPRGCLGLHGLPGKYRSSRQRNVRGTHASISKCAASYPPLSTTARALALPDPRLLIWIPAPPLHELRSRNNAAFNSRDQRLSNPTGSPSERGLVTQAKSRTNPNQAGKSIPNPCGLGRSVSTEDLPEYF
jgi:hypothetical protein